MADINRRAFLKGLAAASVGGALGGRIYGVETPPMPKVAFARMDDPGQEKELVNTAVRSLGGIGRFVREGQKVVIKPNMSFDSGPFSGTTTNPAVVRRVVDMCLEAGASSIKIVDHTLRNPEVCIERSGIRDAVKDLDKVEVKSINSEKDFESAVIDNGSALKQIKIARVLSESDILINLPVAKHHSATRICMGMKNLLGLVWDRRAFHRSGLNQCIVDLSRVIRPDLIIVDGTRILVTNGPGGPGQIDEANSVVAGTDPVAVDAIGIGMTENWLGTKKRRTADAVPHIVMASDAGLGEMDENRIEVIVN